MVDMFDRDKSGQINVQEFAESIDRDRSGFIEHAELTQAFQQMGYRFTLDNFIVVCVNIKRLTDSFRSRDREMRGQAVMQYEDFIGLALGAHK